ncbi:unannotated protein [freshwater metagenome]|uniref:Unannotated protein n=1 Tax=freshwater metagenome TaxID=449393 RepID=A0A6J7UZY5_9ZZZZ
MSIRHRALSIWICRSPLICACGAVGEFPLVAKERVEVGVVPSDRRASPRTLDTARGGVNTLTGTKAVNPAQTLLLKWRSLWLATD